MSDKDATVQTVTLPQDVWDLIDADADRSGQPPDAVVVSIPSVREWNWMPRSSKF